MELKELYNKVTDFESRISSEAMKHSQCRKGCSKCCYTDISVFEVEAKNIREWVKTHHPPLNHPVVEGACSFLNGDACTIYEARPLICRTQGLAMSFKENDQIFADICPLNEDMLDVLADSEFLNLDLLNTILSRLEKLDSGEKNRERVKLTSLRNSLWTPSQKP